MNKATLKTSTKPTTSKIIKKSTKKKSVIKNPHKNAVRGVKSKAVQTKHSLVSIPHKQLLNSKNNIISSTINDDGLQTLPSSSLLSLLTPTPLTPTKRRFTTKYLNQYSKMKPQVQFDNHVEAYKTKTTGELLFTDAIFTLCRIPALVKHAPFLIKTTRIVLGDNFLEFALRQTFYKHFCAGANENEVIPTISSIAKDGIGAILDYGAEPEDESMSTGKQLPQEPTASTPTSDLVEKVKKKQQQHEHSHGGVPCTHNHGNNNNNNNKNNNNTNNTQQEAEDAVDGHIKAHEDLHNVFGFANKSIKSTPNGVQQMDDAIFDFTKTSANPSEIVVGQEESKQNVPTTLITRGNNPNRRYAFAEEKHFDSECRTFKRSIDAAVNTKKAIKKIIDDYYTSSKNGSNNNNNNNNNNDRNKKYTQDEIDNLGKVFDEPTFIAIKITALASTEFLNRASTLINFHSYMWDVFSGRNDATIYYSKNKPKNDHVPTDDEFVNGSLPTYMDDKYDTIDRKTFCDKLVQFYDLTLDDANDFFDFCSTDENKRVITRHNWQGNVNLHHLLSLSNKLIVSKLPPMPTNTNALLFNFPTSSSTPLIDREDIDHLNRTMQRLDDVCKHAKDTGASIFVDAEQTYYQQAIDHITMDLMASYNTPAPDGYYRVVPNIEKVGTGSDALLKTKKLSLTTTTTTTTTTTPSSQPNSNERLKSTNIIHDDSYKEITGGKDIDDFISSIGQKLDQVDQDGQNGQNIGQNRLSRLNMKKLQHLHEIMAMDTPTQLLPAHVIDNGNIYTNNNTTSPSPDNSKSAPVVVNHPVVWHTYQCYLKDSMYRLRRDFALSQEHNFTFAAKIVRGAYIQAESERAIQNGYTNPLHDSIDDTHDNYNKAMLFLLSQRNLNPSNPAHVLIASHNQHTFEIATNYLHTEANSSADNHSNNEKALKIPNHKKRVYFAQLYGMGQRLTYPLAAKGYGAYNYLTYGPPIMCLPYLLRRAAENGSMLGGTATESKLLRREIWRRLTGGKP